MFSFVFVVNCKCLSWCTWLPQFPLWPRCSCCFYLRFPFSMTDHWVSPHLVFPLLFFLQLFPIFACCCLAIYLLISVFAVHCTVLGAVDFCSLCVPICMSQDSSEIYAYCCWCFMCLSALLCFCRLHFFFPPPFNLYCELSIRNGHEPVNPHQSKIPNAKKNVPPRKSHASSHHEKHREAPRS